MKRKVFEVDVTAQRASRTAGDPPALGQLSKVEDVESASAKRRERRRREEPAEPQKEEIDWFSRLGMLALLLLGIAAVGVFFYYTVIPKLNPGQSADQGSPAAGVADRSDGQADGGDATTIGQPDGQEVLDLMRRALSVRFVSKVDDFFRFGAAVGPTEIVDFLKGMEQRDGLVVGMQLMEPLELAGRMVPRVRVEYAKGSDEFSRIAMLVREGKEEWRVDYEAFAAHCEPSWKKLRNAEVEEAVVRVLVLPTEGADDGRAGYALFAKGADPGESLVAECALESAQGKALASLNFEEGSPAKRMTLVVRAVPDSQPKRLEILRVMAIDWVVLDPAYDLSFH